MISHQLHLELATARRDELIAEARAARFAHEARGNRQRRIESWTRRHSKPGLRGRAARRARGTRRTAPVGPEVTS